MTKRREKRCGKASSSALYRARLGIAWIERYCVGWSSIPRPKDCIHLVLSLERYRIPTLIAAQTQVARAGNRWYT